MILPALALTMAAPLVRLPLDCESPAASATHDRSTTMVSVAMRSRVRRNQGGWVRHVAFSATSARNTTMQRIKKAFIQGLALGGASHSTPML